MACLSPVEEMRLACALLTEVSGQAGLHCWGEVGLESLFSGVSIWAVSISPWLRGAGAEPFPTASSCGGAYSSLKWHTFQSSGEEPLAKQHATVAAPLLGVPKPSPQLPLPQRMPSHTHTHAHSPSHTHTLTFTLYLPTPSINSLLLLESFLQVKDIMTFYPQALRMYLLRSRTISHITTTTLSHSRNLITLY